jgi:uncharacterized OB-fold protein
MMLLYSSTGRPLPVPTPFAQHWFDALKAKRLLLQYCPRMGPFFYPRPRCPCCLRDDWAWREASGAGTVHTFAVQSGSSSGGSAAASVEVLAVVNLAEGPRVTAEIHCPPESIRVGMKVQAAYVDIEGLTLLAFAPA